MTKPNPKPWVHDLASAAWLAGCDQRDIGALFNTVPPQREYYRGWMTDFMRAYEGCLMRQTSVRPGGEIWDRRRAHDRSH